MPKLLLFVPKSDPILRKVMPPIVDFNSDELKTIIEDMSYSILPEQLDKANTDSNSAAGMAANQWGIDKRIFIYTPDGSQPENEKEVMLNPSYRPILRDGEKKPKMVPGFEACFSIPFATGIVNRYECILATYYTPKGKKVERVLEGWLARVFQHETDHLDGKLYDGCLDNLPGPDCTKRFSFKDKDEMDRFFDDLRKQDEEKI